MKCAKCGNEITGDDKFCMYCGAEVKRSEPVNSYQQQQTRTQTSTAQNQYTTTPRTQYEDPSMPTLSDGEYKITSYLCSELKFPKCEGRMTVTNKRLIFHGVGGGFSDNRIVQEVGIKEVRGISSYYGLHIYWGKLILGILLILIGFSGINMMSQLYGYGDSFINNKEGIYMLVVMLVGIYLVITAFRKAYFLNVYTRAMSAGIEIGNGANTLVGNSAVFSIVGAPSRETNKMMKELGSMVMEIQKYDEN